MHFNFEFQISSSAAIIAATIAATATAADQRRRYCSRCRLPLPPTLPPLLLPRPWLPSDEEFQMCVRDWSTLATLRMSPQQGRTGDAKQSATNGSVTEMGGLDGRTIGWASGRTRTRAGAGDSKVSGGHLHACESTWANLRLSIQRNFNFQDAVEMQRRDGFWLIRPARARPESALLRVARARVTLAALCASNILVTQTNVLTLLAPLRNVCVSFY